MHKNPKKLLMGILLLASIGLGVLLLIRDLSAGTNLSTCVWTGTARSWIDDNVNGIKESEEEPLPGVTYVLLYKGHRFIITSDLEGEAHFLLRIPCETTGNLELYAEAVEGYQFTTGQRIHSIPVDVIPEEPFLFGFTQ